MSLPCLDVARACRYQCSDIWFDCQPVAPIECGWMGSCRPQDEREVCEKTGARGPMLRAIALSNESKEMRILRMMLVLLEDPS